jgi:hypothetical protein
MVKAAKSLLSIRRKVREREREIIQTKRTRKHGTEADGLGHVTRPNAQQAGHHHVSLRMHACIAERARRR